MTIQRKEILETRRGPKYLFEDPNELRLLVQDYFSTCNETNTPYTITGLCIALGTTRQTLWNYLHLHEVDQEIIDILTEARARCELWLEENMLRGTANTIGCIFSLKNNYGWRDKPDEREKPDESENISMIMEKRRARLADLRNKS